MEERLLQPIYEKLLSAVGGRLTANHLKELEHFLRRFHAEKPAQLENESSVQDATVDDIRELFRTMRLTFSLDSFDSFLSSLKFIPIWEYREASSLSKPIFTQFDPRSCETLETAYSQRHAQRNSSLCVSGQNNVVFDALRMVLVTPDRRNEVSVRRTIRIQANDLLSTVAQWWIYFSGEWVVLPPVYSIILEECIPNGNCPIDSETATIIPVEVDLGEGLRFLMSDGDGDVLLPDGITSLRCRRIPGENYPRSVFAELEGVPRGVKKALCSLESGRPAEVSMDDPELLTVVRLLLEKYEVAPVKIQLIGWNGPSAEIALPVATEECQTTKRFEWVALCAVNSWLISVGAPHLFLSGEWRPLHQKVAVKVDGDWFWLRVHDENCDVDRPVRILAQGEPFVVPRYLFDLSVAPDCFLSGDAVLVLPDVKKSDVSSALDKSRFTDASKDSSQLVKWNHIRRLVGLLPIEYRTPEVLSDLDLSMLSPSEEINLCRKSESCAVKGKKPQGYRSRFPVRN